MGAPLVIRVHIVISGTPLFSYVSTYKLCECAVQTDIPRLMISGIGHMYERGDPAVASMYA